ncbi:MAG TPA: amidohydrolase family protein [Acidimicrobiales bacterium]|nr:amidohydrolase family protein [Acidimicrobiales bacterium]
MTKLADDRYIVISSDCHAGAQMQDYREYLAKKWHPEFDEWAKSYVNPFDDLAGETAYRNWDSDRRLRELEDDAVVAEVLFPNTIPPFFPSGLLTTRPPADRDDYDRRFAGMQAHNRWLADFCKDAPGRRAGMAQIFLNDVDDAVAEIRWAKEAGLFGGILLPGVPPDCDLPPLYAPDYEPIWAVCEELGMPINNHAGQAAPDFGRYPATPAIFVVELSWFSHRVFWHMLFGKAFANHPGLKLVLTEQASGWVPGVLAMLDSQYRRFLTPGTAESRFGGPLATELKQLPSETWAQNCFLGSSFLRRSECELRGSIGVDKIMWGQDYPHTEGTFPYTREALRNTFAGVPTDEVAAMLGGNAARVYGFDLDALAPIAAKVGPTVAEVNVALDKVPADAYSVAFTGENAKPW